jgi:hypothetical protein
MQGRKPSGKLPRVVRAGAGDDEDRACEFEEQESHSRPAHDGFLPITIVQARLFPRVCLRWLQRQLTVLVREACYGKRAGL